MSKLLPSSIHPCTASLSDRTLPRSPFSPLPGHSQGHFVVDYNMAGCIRASRSQQDRRPARARVG
eukprot:4909423-Alexandrium_andersonii.AAC.1